MFKFKIFEHTSCPLIRIYAHVFIYDSRYEIMRSCWFEDKKERPCFEELKETLLSSKLGFEDYVTLRNSDEDEDL